MYNSDSKAGKQDSEEKMAQNNGIIIGHNLNIAQ
jgi:hypothetical protein